MYAKLLIIILIFFSFVFVSSVYAALAPELMVNDKLKQCVLEIDPHPDKYKLIDGWRYDECDEQKSKNCNWGDSAERCKELGYNLLNVNIYAGIKERYIATRLFLVFDYIAFVIFSILAYKKFFKKEYETSCCIIPVMIFFIFFLSVLFCFFLFE